MRNASGFELRVLPETFFGGGQGTIQLAVEETAQGALVRVTGVEMQGLKALAGELSYPAGYAPAEAQAGMGLGPAEQVLSLCVLDQPGAVQLGAALKGCSTAPGVDGSAELALVRFMRGTAASTARRASSPPVALNAAPLLAVNCTKQTVEWWHNLPGDFNQDGQVDTADLVTLANHFGEKGVQMPALGINETAPLPGSCIAFPLDSIQAVIDLNGDAEIDMGDLSAMGANYGARISSWNLYRSFIPASDYPDLSGGGAAPSKLAPVSSNIFADNDTGDPQRERIHYSLPLDVLDDGLAYWVRPVDDAVEGTPSNWAPYDASLAGSLRFQRGQAAFLEPVRGYLDLEVSTTGPKDVLAVIQASLNYLYALDGRIFYDTALLKPVLDDEGLYAYPQGLGGVDQFGTQLILESFYAGSGIVKLYSETGPHLEFYHGTFRAVQLKFTLGTEPHPAALGGTGLASSAVVAPLLAYTPSTAELSWFHCLRADCNQDGDSDKNEIPVLWYYIGYGNPADPAGVSILADSNFDGRVNVGDLTYIGMNYGHLSVTGYNVYATLDPANVPIINGDTEDAPEIDMIWHVGLYEQPWYSSQRKRFTFVVPSPQAGMYLWVQPECNGVVGGMKQGCYVQVP